MKAIVLIKMSTGNLRESLHDIKRLRSVAEAHLTIGPYDALAVVHADDLRALGRVVFKEIQPIPGVVETCTYLLVDAEALEDVQVPAAPAEQAQQDDLRYLLRRREDNPFGAN
jgi:DNA-binding Lrp family transcriptional regulator